MPSKWVQTVIVVFWLIMMSMLVKRDLLPSLGFGELKYEQIVANRAVSESTHWVISWDNRRLGSSLTLVRPMSDGSYELSNRTLLSSSVLEEKWDRPTTQVVLSSDIHIGPVGRLKDFECRVSVEGTNIHGSIKGKAEGKTLNLESEGLPFLPKESTIDIDPNMMLLDVVAPLDRIPDLRVGKQWTSRTINPISMVFSPPSLFGSKRVEFDVIQHEVIGTDAATWNDRSWFCYVIEHRQPSGKSKTWVRVHDGRVLRHEVPVYGSVVSLEPDPRLSPFSD